jgi:hypothetical protein
LGAFCSVTSPWPPLGLPLGADRGEEVAEPWRLVLRQLVRRIEREQAADGALRLVLAIERDVVEREQAIDLDLLRLGVVRADQGSGERLDRLLVLLVLEEVASPLDEVLRGLRATRLRLRERDRRDGEHAGVDCSREGQRGRGAQGSSAHHAPQRIKERNFSGGPSDGWA